VKLWDHTLPTWTAVPRKLLPLMTTRVPRAAGLRPVTLGSYTAVQVY
jgi:hypothetical protein